MSRLLSIEDTWYEITNLSHEVGGIFAPALFFSSPFSFHLNISPNSPQIVLLDFKKDASFEMVAETIRSLQERDYLDLFEKIRRLLLLDDPSRLHYMVGQLEKSFNYGRLAIDDAMLQMKIEDMQSHLIDIKRNSAKLLRDPKNMDLRKQISSSFEELLAKLESSIAAKEFLKKIGYEEGELAKEFNIRRRESGSVRGEWKIS